MNCIQRWTARVVPALLLAAMVATLAGPAAQADPPASGPGSYDTTFGAGTGRVNYGSGFGESFDSVAVQPDGKIVAGFLGAGSGAYIYRLLANGTPDPAWNGGSAYAWTDASVPAVAHGPAAALAQDSAGRTYVTSAVLVGFEIATPQVAVLRLTPAGVPDPTWGTSGTGVVTYDFGGSANDHGTSVVVDDSGNRVYVGAWEGPNSGNGTDFAVLALQEGNGALDSAFSGDGLATTDFNGGNDTVRDIAIAPGGDVIAVGYVKGPGGGNDNTGAWRLNSDGSTATGFGANGKAEFDLANGFNDGARSIAIDSLGYSFVSVRVEGSENSSGAVLRLDTVGAADTGFGRLNGAAGAGWVRTGFGVQYSENAAVAVDEAGRAVVVGGANAPTVARLVADRYPQDTTFNGSGSETLTCPGGTAGSAQGVAVQPDGNIVVTGTCPESVSPFNASVNVLWRLKGGNAVPLPTPPIARGGAQTAVLNATGISVNGLGRTVTVSPGAPLSLAFTYHFDNPVADDICSTVCITQVVAGFTNAGPDLCFDAGGAELSGPSAAVSGNLTAPARPGRYYISFDRVYENGCTGGGGTWTGDGKFWAGNIVPAPGTFLAEVNVVDGVNGLTVAPDRATVPFGQRTIPVGAISADDLTGSFANLQSSPLRVSPLRVSPLRVSPLRVSPLRVSPLRVSPLRVSPLRVSPLRVSPIPLSDVPLDPPSTWTTVLAGTPFANQPLQNVTLQQVLDLEPPPASVSALSLADIDLSRTALRNVSLAAFLLGSTPASALGLSDVPAGVNLGKSLLELELTGVDMSPVYVHGIQLRGVTLAGDAPLGRMRLGDLWLSQTPFGAVPLSQLPSTWYTACSGCTTLADAQANNVDTGVKDAATVAAVLALPSTTVNPTVGQVLPGLVSRDQLGYERIPSNRLAAAAPLPSSGVTYTARFTIDCSTSNGAATVDFTLPAGFRPLPSTASVTVAGLGSVPVTPSSIAGGLRLTTSNLACSGAPQVTAKVDAEPGLALGPTTDSVTARFGPASTTVSDDSPVTVVDTDTDTAVPTEAGKPTGTVFLGYVSAPGNQDTYVAPTLPAGTKLTVRLANVSPGHDDDLSVFGPGVPALHSSVGSSPLRVSPLRVSPLRVSGVDDTTLDPSSDTGTAGTEPQPDVPVQPPAGSTVLGVSANRGDAEEGLAYTVPDGASSGPTTIVVSGYNGSNDKAQPYSLLVSVDPPAAPTSCAAPSFPSQGQGTAGTSVSGLPAGTETVILTDKKRLSDLYGSAAATNVMTKLQTLAARTDVKGVVISVEANPAVQTAYNAWDAASCSPAKANQVVTAINAYIDGIRATNSTLKYLVIAGGDQVVPMGRVPDRVDLDNESSFAPEQVLNGKDNALSGSLRGAFLLSDDPYGDLNPAPWLDSSLYVPDVAIGRLVETPADITKAVDQFVASSGVRAPTAAYTAGYDFNSDGAQLVADRLAQRVAATASATAINGTWSKTDAINGMASAAHGFISVNAHYDAYRALPADEFSGGTQNQLLTPTDLPSDLTGGVLFTIGCHTGLNVADTFVATTTEAVRKGDWAQGVASRGGVLAANTGFGYGDSEAVAYSERLMADFAANLDGQMTVGQALMFAKQSSVHLPMAVVDAKVMQEATFYGLPMYKLGAGGISAPAVLPTAPVTGTTSSAGTPQTASFTGSRQLVPQSGPRGTWYGVQGAGSPVQAPLAIPGRPLQPETSDSYAQPTDGQVAHGIIVDDLTTRVTSATGSFNPVYSAATPDSSTTRPEPQTVGAFFPATLANVVERATPQGLRDVIVLHPGQFRSSSPDSGLGFQQLTDEMTYHLLYSDKADVTPPEIGTVDGTVSGPTVTFTVTTPDGDVRAATALFLARSSTTGQSWTRVQLTSTNGRTWSGSAPAGAATVEQYFVQLLDDANNVSVSSKKGQDFAAPAQPPSADGPVVQVAGTPVGGSYIGPQQVMILGAGPVTYGVGTGTTVVPATTPYTGPFTVTGPGTLTISAAGSGGTGTLTLTIAPPPAPTVSITSPSATTSYTAGEAIPGVFSCSGYQVTSCAASPTSPDTSLGAHTFTVTATDAAGRTGTASVTYTVRSSPFEGFLIPVADGPGSTPSVFPRRVPVLLRFRLVDSSGKPIADRTALKLALACDPRLSYSVVSASPGAPVNAGCFVYNPFLHEFDFLLSTTKLTAGSTYLLRVHFTSGWVADHTVQIKIR